MNPYNVHTPEMFAEAYAGRRPEWYAVLLASIMQYGRPGPIVDLGAGLGLFCELASSWGIPIVGFEASEHAIQQAKGRKPQLDMRHHDLSDALPLPDAWAGNVVLFQVAEHLEPPTLNVVLRESHRVLRPDGRLFLYSPSIRNREERKEQSHINLMLPTQMDRLLSSHGFHVLQHRNSQVFFAPNARSRVARISARWLFRLFPMDWVSATTNVIAMKSGEGMQ